MVFAKNDIEARRWGANEFSDGDLRGMTVKRMKEWDQYADMGIPISEMIYAGCWMDCDGCGERMSEDWFYDQRMSPSDARGTEGGMSYCCWQCEADDKADRAAKEAFGQVFVDLLQEKVVARYGPVKFKKGFFQQHHYVTRHNGHMQVEDACVSFEFPGVKYGTASLRFNMSGKQTWHGHEFLGPPELQTTVPNGDHDAFKAWAAEIQKERTL